MEERVIGAQTIRNATFHIVTVGLAPYVNQYVGQIIVRSVG